MSSSVYSTKLVTHLIQIVGEASESDDSETDAQEIQKKPGQRSTVMVSTCLADDGHQLHIAILTRFVRIYKARIFPQPQPIPDMLPLPHVLNSKQPLFQRLVAKLVAVLLQNPSLILLDRHLLSSFKLVLQRSSLNYLRLLEMRQ